MSKFNRPELILKLMETFLDELDEHVNTVNDELLKLEKCAADSPEHTAIIRSLFRAAHSLKGAARAVDVGSIEELCHHLEDLLGRIRDKEVALSADLVQLLFTVAGALGRVGAQLRKKQAIDKEEVQQLVERLQQISASVIAASDASAPAPAEPAPHSVTEDQIDSCTAVDTECMLDKLTIEKPVIQLEVKLTQPIVDSSFVAASHFDLESDVISGPESHSMRVASEKLDRLLALSSEFLTSYRRSETWQSSAEEMTEKVRINLCDWLPMEKQLKQLMDTSLDEFKATAAEVANLKSVSTLTAKNVSSSSSNPNSSQAAAHRNSNSPLRKHAIITQRLVGAPTANTKMLKELLKDMERFVSSLKSEVRAIGETARLVDEEIRGLRMRPFSDACLGLQLAIRELCISTGKEVQLEIHGGNVELDRSVLENLKDPLLHIVRNAIQHGIESPQQRASAGKSPQSTIQLSASLRGTHVQIEVSDDGRGLDEEAVRQRARANGIAEPQTRQELASLIFLPWFSTETAVNTVSGRGVGLDVVVNQLAALQGAVSVDYEVGKGACFTLTVPLTLTKIRVVVFKLNGQFFAFPSSSVQRLLRIDLNELSSIENRPVLAFEGKLIAIARLAEALKFSDDNAAQSGQRVPAVVLSQGNVKRAFLVDELISEHEVVVTNLGSRLQRLRNVSGATLLANGEIALILNPADLLRRFTESGNNKPLRTEESVKTKLKRLIIADDSPTTRILEASILEAAGYDVRSVADGQEAWELLQAQGADLIVSDVEMPIMDGFTLTSTIRASEKWSDMPVILVTGLAKAGDRDQGLKAGASAYIVKSEFDQSELINTIEQLI